MSEHLVDRLLASGARRGDAIGLATSRDGRVAISRDQVSADLDPASVAKTIAAIDAELAPRWVMWDQRTAATLVAHGIRLVRSWDLAAADRFVHGGWATSPALIWARLHDLDPNTIPVERGPDLFNQIDPAVESASPIDPDGYLRASWSAGGWEDFDGGAVTWASLALRCARLQRAATDTLPDPPRTLSALRSESSIELLCSELAADGLPLDEARANELIAGYIGPRPTTQQDEFDARAQRDAAVFAAAPGVGQVDLRSPGQVRTLLRRVGIEVPDTRAWRLKELRDRHPIVEALLTWRKAERIESTFGYRWLDENVSGGRLRGVWSGCDGAAGRMTASAGLHNLPAELRDAVRAEPGYVFVRADLGQIEPRVLAVVSGDPKLAEATRDDDLYAPVAGALGVPRDVAKVAVLGAMYGQTTGIGAEALRGLNAAYPVAMAYLERADRSAQAANDLRTFGGRLIRLSASSPSPNGTEDRAAVAARGRFGRNAMVQGAAAEFFKVWALTVRARVAPLDARIVLCLHDELLVHTPAEYADKVAAAVDAALQEAAARWAPSSDGRSTTGRSDAGRSTTGHSAVRFVAETSVVTSWADAK
ncbi:MAG TPA: DNA polymerase [Microthrixaceae bacterium]|nr:DNA polymerase [Microthrixaceae bacterium]